MDKKVLLASNVSLENHDNTLTAFKNDITPHYLPAHKTFRLYVESIGIHCKFINNIISKNNELPSVIYVPDEYMEENIWFREKIGLEIFKNYHKIYLNPDETYSEESLNEHLRLTQ